MRGGPMAEPTHDQSPPMLLLYSVQAIALAVLAAARHFHLIAHESMWLYAGVIIVPSIANGRLDQWIDAPRVRGASTFGSSRTRPRR